MAELGKIDMPSVEQFKTGRRLCLVPLIFRGRDPDSEYLQRFYRYWQQVEEQLSNLEEKLGKITHIYHEIVTAGSEDGLKAIKELNECSARIVESWLARGARLETTEDFEILAEYMDWSRCLSIGFESRNAFTRVYESYQEAGKKRNEHIARQIDQTLKGDEIGVLFITQGHQVQFPPDIQVFYVSPPALDEIERWLRDQRAKAQEQKEEKGQKGEGQD